MSLDPGARLGPYEVLAPLGAGGMGEVYRARDPRLGRDVAIKVLPSGLSADAERLRRFEQEARAAAALNHPNILAVHDIGQHDSAPYIVSELLEGDTLRERLAGMPLPVRKAVDYAVQIAHGLAAAHEKGITHRDLKPENVFVTSDGRVKILDFGLAKLTQAEPALSGMSALPTTPPDTLPGVVLGTIGYMSPEQVRGQHADHRSDIFAFGVILYEMLSGRRAFHRETSIETMSAILKEDPPDLPVAERHIPPALARIVDRCLEKNPAARFKSADDLAFALEALSSSSDSASSGALPPTALPQQRSALRSLMVIGAVSALAGAALAASVMGYLQSPVSDERAYRASVLPSPGVNLTLVLTPNARFALSPDGQRLAFVGLEAGGVTRLWVQSLDGVSAQPLSGTEAASVPFWSPDGRHIGFYAGDKLKIIDAAGGPPSTLADVTGTPGATWNQEGTILFANFTPGNPLRRVSASVGTPSVATTLDVEQGEARHWFPFFLPDGRHFLYLAIGSKAGGPSTPNGIYVGALDSNERKLLVPGGSSVMYAQGHLFYLREQTLLAHPFDIDRLELTGDPVPVADLVTTGGQSGMAGGFSVSTTGVLAYQTGSAGVGGQGNPTTQLVWLDRSGKQIGTLGEPSPYADLQLAPDGRQAVVSLFDAGRGSRDIWVFDVARGLRTRFTFDPVDEFSSAWSPDGSRLVFNAFRKANLDLFVKPSSGAGAEEALLADASDKYPLDWSLDGRFVLYQVVNPTLEVRFAQDLWVLPLSGDRKPRPFVQTPFGEGGGQFSPDGRWIAYFSNESGRNEVYVAPFPGPGGKWQISTAGGLWPRWRPDGTEIYYFSLDSRLMAATINGQGDAFIVGGVQPLFATRAGAPRLSYDVSPDGQRFLINMPPEADAPVPITLVVNWPALLRK